MIAPEFSFVRSDSFPNLSDGQEQSLAATIHIARRRVEEEIFRVAAELNESGSRANPEMLAERIREVRRRQEVLADITGLQVAVGAAGKS